MSITLNDLFGLPNVTLEKSVDVNKNDKVVKKIYLKYSGEMLKVCPNCGGKLYKHDKRHLEALDTPFCGYPANIDIEFSRMRCPDCKYLWQPTFESVDENRKMTKRAFIDITQRGLRNVFEDVCNDYDLTGNTAKNVFVDFMNENNNRLRFKTPSFMGIDEIKIKKIGEITVITDLEHRTLFDMLKGRNQDELTAYCVTLADRENVLWICSDMYRPFEKTIGDAFPNARWVIDKFHVTMKANEAIDKVRRTLQDSMDKKERIQTKRGLAYTLKTRLRDLTTEEAEKIRAIRDSEKHKPMAIAFDLKEDFFNIYDENPTSKENAQKAFEKWEASIPEGELYDKFRELANTVHNFYEQVFAYWDCPIAITNGFTECTNRIIRENNMRGRGYSFEVLRGRTLYRKSNLNAIINNNLAFIGPPIPEDEPVFHFDSSSGDEDEDDDYEPFPETEYNIDSETGEIIE